jgi:hypothetical protein
MYTSFWWENLSERYHLEGPGVYGRIILRWIFRKWDGRGMDWIDRIQTVAGTGKCGKQPSGSIKRGGFIDYLKTG